MRKRKIEGGGVWCPPSHCKQLNQLTIVKHTFGDLYSFFWYGVPDGGGGDGGGACDWWWLCYFLCLVVQGDRVGWLVRSLACFSSVWLESKVGGWQRAPDSTITQLLIIRRMRIGGGTQLPKWFQWYWQKILQTLLCVWVGGGGGRGEGVVMTEIGQRKIVVTVAGGASHYRIQSKALW